MARELPHERRIALVDKAFRHLPQRYLGADPGFDATYHVRLGDLGHTWEVRATTGWAHVRKGLTSRRPDVVIGTDATTWLELCEGRYSGLEAFADRRLYARATSTSPWPSRACFACPTAASHSCASTTSAWGAIASPR